MITKFKAGSLYRNEVERQYADFDLYVLAVAAEEERMVWLSCTKVDRATGQSGLPEELRVYRADFQDWEEKP